MKTLRIATGLLTIFLTQFMLFNLSAYALTPEQKKVFDSGIYYFDVADQCIPSSGGSSNKVTGSVYILGDSITVGAADSYNNKLPVEGIQPTLSAVASRSWVSPGQPQGEGWQVGTTGSGKEAVETDSSQVSTANAVVIALGTNNFEAGNPIDEIYNTIKQKNQSAPIFWINTALQSPGNSALISFNTRLNQLQSEGKIKVIDWANVVDPGGDGTNNSSGLLSDGIHPSALEGVEALTNLVVSSLKGSSTNVSSSAPGSVAPSNFNPDPAAVEIYQNDLLPKIQPLIPLYQRAAQEKGLADWELLPALHQLEFGLRRDNPTTNTGFRTPFQMNANSLRRQGLPVDSDPMFQPGKELTDEEFVRAAGYAAEFWLIPDGRTLDIDATQNITPEEAGKLVAAYKSGAGSVWFNGRADFNLHAYAWAGFDTTPEHRLPMAWGAGSPYGDEVAGTRLNKPGAATVFALLKGGNFGGTGVSCIGGEQETTGSLSPISGSKEEIIQRILSNSNIKWGNYGNGSTQRQDVQDCLSDNTLAGFLALADQSGIEILVNALARDHGGCTGATTGSDHNRGEAIDIGYYGNGDSRFKPEGNTLYKFIYDNRQALKADQLIWKEPPQGFQCLDNGQPVGCYEFYGAGIMNQHHHHIHISFQ